MEIKESSLSRVWRHMQEHDTGFITAWRGAEDCGQGRPFTRSHNKSRNRSLAGRLSVLGYYHTKVRGRWQDAEGNYQSEDSFFVVDYDDIGGLQKSLIKLGKIFEQDAVLFLPAGRNGYFISTNKCPVWPGFGEIGEIEPVGRMISRGDGIGTSVGGRWFQFEQKPVLERYRLQGKNLWLAQQYIWTAPPYEPIEDEGVDPDFGIE